MAKKEEEKESPQVVSVGAPEVPVVGTAPLQGQPVENAEERAEAIAEQDLSALQSQHISDEEMMERLYDMNVYERPSTEDKK